MAAATSVASVPSTSGWSARPPAAAMRTSGPAISAASSATPRASAALCETRTMPDHVPVGGAAPPQRATSRADDVAPGPGGRRCARPGSWPGPCGPASGMVASRPCVGRLRRPRAVRRRSAPPTATVVQRVHGGGRSASSMVLSPGFRLAAGDTPSMPASQAPSQGRRIQLGGRPGGGAHPQEQRAVQRPAGPAHGAHQRHAHLLSSAAGSAYARSAISAHTACMPRCMFVPWSASPISASRPVRTSFCSAIDRANTSSQRRSSRPCRCRGRRRPSDAPPQGRGHHRRIPEAEELVVHPHERQRAARHVQAGDVRADQRPDHRDPGLLRIVAISPYIR